MKFRFAFGIALAMCLLFQTPNFCAAEEGAASPRPVGAVTVNGGPGGMSVPTGKFIGVLNYRYAEKDNWYHYSVACDGADREAVSHTMVTKFRYGIAPGWDVRTATPFASTEARLDGECDNYIGGIGDTLVILRHQFMAQKKGAPVSLAWDLGVNTPTGEVGEGKIGSGAWGGMAGLGATYMFGSHRIDGDVNYLVYTEGAHDTRKGDRFRANAHYAYAVNSLLDLGVEANYEWLQENRRDGKGLNNDIKTLYVGPKFNLKFKEYGMTFGGALLGAAYRESQKQTLTEDWRMEFKLVKVF